MSESIAGCHVARTALDAGLAPVMIVIGAHADEVRAALADLPVEIVYNPNWAEGQSTSVQAGLQSLPPGTDAAIFLLADQPHILAALVRTARAARPNSSARHRAAHWRVARQSRPLRPQHLPRFDVSPRRRWRTPSIFSLPYYLRALARSEPAAGCRHT